MKDFWNNNPLVGLLIFVVVAIALVGNKINVGGASYAKRRAAAKARAAKKRKAKSRKR